ncbi:MAG: D-alanine--D-alanine ligase A [Legionellales bacterium]|mgnify:CR=1 FL=1|nr:D-alanine--D-alanine ligase A [Legionellales bacterium]|tara:strand:- start:41255 stop:42355 length:1101 start_codon:yes stop_codon:yes gene_type:complete
MSKINVGILYGGRSAEHEISLISAKSVVQALDRDRYDIHLIGISKNGKWFLQPLPTQEALSRLDALSIITDHDKQVNLVANEHWHELLHVNNDNTAIEVDVFFPVLHGPFGEDGTIQGLLRMARAPFVGSDVLSTALCMDKDYTKRLLKERGLPTCDHLCLHSHNYSEDMLDTVIETLGLPCFVKPANLGSSVAINKAKTKAELAAAIQEAFGFDHKIILEAFIDGREIECAVLGNELPKASVLGEILTQFEFYSYEAKYADTSLKLDIPADVPAQTSERIQELAIAAFEALDCHGMARVDFFLQNDGAIYINEINTIPGFTPVSMYPLLWQASGLEYPALIDQLIELALERFDRQSSLRSEYSRR